MADLSLDDLLSGLEAAQQKKSKVRWPPCRCRPCCCHHQAHRPGVCSPHRLRSSFTSCDHHAIMQNLHQTPVLFRPTLALFSPNLLTASTAPRRCARRPACRSATWWSWW